MIESNAALSADDWKRRDRETLQGKRSRKNWASLSRKTRASSFGGAIGAVFSSWMNARAITYRRLHNIPAAWGTAVNVQAMVFGNMGKPRLRALPSRATHRQAKSKLYGEFLVNAQGEDVVAGIRTPQKHHRGSAHRRRFRQALA